MNLPGKNKLINNIIFGGTFDPIHNGHIEIIKKIKILFNPKIIYVIPSGNPYMKPKPPVASPIERLQMCKIAFKDFENVKVIDYEIHRKDPSYTYDTIEYLSSININIDSLILGQDSYLEINKWKNGVFLKNKYNFIVIKRNTSASLPINPRNCFYIEKISTLSSSLIREKIILNKSINEDTPIEITKYIEDNNLYKNGQNN
ncbi:MAG: nicotinate (nicotinamide) nucleotide adenylyltransferase [Dehalococcoidia bacterium]|nr:MAG: nicotinate (nicotinamide) nucleotide adenylyltransferase [Chloroflexota bacterium]|tara:strand:- start:1009 stop:1614 length:606 start_codon:yes stop_codon:yes gene_type:complete